MRTAILIIMLAVICVGCVKETNTSKFEPKFVIEGVIEEGGYPVVKITHNIPKDYIINKEQLENLIVRWATVKVSNKGEEEILTLVRDDEAFPYFFYVGTSLKGKAGEKYQLEVIYNDIVLRSETEIPLYKPLISDVAYRWIDAEKAQPSITVVNSNPEANYCMFMKLASQRNFYTTSPKGFKAMDQADGQYPLFLLKSRRMLDPTSNQSKYYAKGDEVTIKVSNVSKSSYTMWGAISQQGLQFSFLNYSSNFRGNIEGAGIGIWYGANSAVEKLSIK